MSDKLPIYIQIHNQMREWIIDGKWQINEKIPSERALTEVFDVSRMTVRQAISTLVTEGYLERRVGAGTFVASEKVKESFSEVSSFTDTIIKSGRKPSSKLVTYSIKKPSESEIEKLELSSDELVLFMERIRYADEMAICFEQASIPQKFIEGIDKEDLTLHFYKSLKDYKGIEIGNSEQIISATWASESLAELLKIKRGDSVLSLRQTTYSKNGEPFEYVRSQYVGDRYEIIVN